MSFTDQLHNIR